MKITVENIKRIGLKIWHCYVFSDQIHHNIFIAVIVDYRDHLRYNSMADMHVICLYFYDW